MSWQDFHRVLVECDADPETWQSAIQANPNMPQDALWVAVSELTRQGDSKVLANFIWDMAQLLTDCQSEIKQYNCTLYKLNILAGMQQALLDYPVLEHLSGAK